MRSAINLLCLILLITTVPAQAKTHRHKEKHTAHRRVYSRGTTTGIASWYGKDHQGKKMSDGRPFDRFKYTAAHKTLPLHTKIRVKNMSNGKTVMVLITDRGPWVHNRILDLSEAAAREIHCSGVCKVSYEVAENPERRN